jgi:hypothetical protein
MLINLHRLFSFGRGFKFKLPLLNSWLNLLFEDFAIVGYWQWISVNLAMSLAVVLAKILYLIHWYITSSFVHVGFGVWCLCRNLALKARLPVKFIKHLVIRPWSPVQVKQWSEHDSKKPKVQPVKTENSEHLNRKCWILWDKELHLNHRETDVKGPHAERRNF